MNLKSILFFFLLTFLLNDFAQAQKSAVVPAGRSCQLVEQLAEEMGCDLSLADPSEGSRSNSKDFVLNATFGPSDCKTGTVLKDSVRELKEECNTWLKERRGDLKDKYQTGTCSEECSDCGTALKRCLIKGLVHYAK